jgi:hypothetical protein
MENTKLVTKEVKKRFMLPYKELAEKYETTYTYVSSIANGDRKPIRGKGLKIKQELEAIFSK